MFGRFTLELEGRRYYGNVSLRECHAFASGPGNYVFDVQGMVAHAIPPQLTRLIAQLGTDPSALIPEAAMTALRDLGLVAGEEDRPAETGPEPVPGVAAGDPTFPVASVGLFLAQECNMRCVYCYGEAGGYAGGGRMDASTALRVVDWLVEHSGNFQLLSLSFFGGEPLLNFPLMRAVVPYARQKATAAGKKMVIGLTTNGTLLTDEVIAFLRDEQVVFAISFDGPPEIHNRQRPFKDGAGSYEQVAANVRKLRNVLPHLAARATLCGETVPLVVKEAAKQAGFTTCSLAPASPVLLRGSGGSASAGPADEGRMQQLLALHRREADELLTAIRARSLTSACPPGALVAMETLLIGQKRHYGCGIGKDMLGIAVNGDIYPCHRFVGLRDMRLGNIADYTPGEPNAYHWAVVIACPSAGGAGPATAAAAAASTTTWPQQGTCTGRIPPCAGKGEPCSRGSSMSWASWMRLTGPTPGIFCANATRGTPRPCSRPDNRRPASVSLLHVRKCETAVPKRGAQNHPAALTGFATARPAPPEDAIQQFPVAKKNGIRLRARPRTPPSAPTRANVCPNVIQNSRVIPYGWPRCYPPRLST
ncbi:MAG: radical SAM protein [Solidesulfovibrio sp.]|uniref:radical SAM protein n=1 Tax=Solidesulfovibrio sp. TaxID=2910990 RepID=UPI002B21B2DA|nr:radical SAM protein [Solidesulfovibrio sp.]MEA4856156.1 radical SAM protein [Solidesulfovibrio sp.]